MRIILLLSILLFSCSTPYQPKGILGGYSFIETEENIFRVEFKGNQHTIAKTVFNYLERKCAEITIENGFDYFIVYDDSSYIDETIFAEEPELDDKIAAQRKDKYLLTEEQVLDTDPRQTLWDQKTKIDRTYNRSFISNQSTDIIGVYKIMLVDEIIENLREYYRPAQEILDKFGK